MKKITSIILTLLLVVLLASCGSKTETPSEKSTGNSEDSDNSENVKVDEGLLHTKITVPSSFFEDTSEDEIKVAAEEEGFKSYKINSDGSVTYTMSKKKHKEMISELSDTIDEYMDELVNGDEDSKVESFTNIEANDDYSEINIYVNKDSYTEWDSIYAMFFFIQSAYYQIFSGVSPDDIAIEVNYIDDVTGDIINSSSYSEWIEALDDIDTINDNTGDVSTSKTETVIKNLKLNETVKVGELMEITLSESEWVDSITPSDKSGAYTYYEDQDGEKYFLIRGTLKNLGKEDLDIQWINESEVLINETYAFSGSMELESNDGTDFYGTAKPLQTLNLIIYASVSDEAYEICETIDVSMKILSDSEHVDYFYDDDFPHETLKISFSN